MAPPKRKKESKKQRRTRIAGEIYDNMVRIKDALDLFRSSCLFCQQTRYVSVDTVFLLTHLGAVHDRDAAVKEALGGEDTQHCIDRIRRHLKDVRVRDSIFTYDVVDEFALSGYGKYRCCYCSSERVFSEYSELFKHVEKEHETTVLTCHLCQNIFLNYGSYASHVCFGPPSTPQAARAKFRCKICKKQDMGNFFDFQFHVRKTHNACEMCFKVRSQYCFGLISTIVMLISPPALKYPRSPWGRRRGKMREKFHPCAGLSPQSCPKSGTNPYYT